jgi:hypothetical protein
MTFSVGRIGLLSSDWLTNEINSTGLSHRLINTEFTFINAFLDLAIGFSVCRSANLGSGWVAMPISTVATATVVQQITLKINRLKWIDKVKGPI